MFKRIENLVNNCRRRSVILAQEWKLRNRLDGQNGVRQSLLPIEEWRKISKRWDTWFLSEPGGLVAANPNLFMRVELEPQPYLPPCPNTKPWLGPAD